MTCQHNRRATPDGRMFATAVGVRADAVTHACLLLALCVLVSAATSRAAEPDHQVQTLQPGVQLKLVAEHPDLVTPTGIDVDKQGRVWLAASHTHFRPDNYDGPQHDEILVFDRFDSQGRAHRRHVFYNDTDATMDLLLGEDGWVYLAERDRILRVRDSDGDGVGDLQEELAVLATNADYPHNGLAGLAWHTNGELLFGLGENFAEPWTLAGRDGRRFQGTGEGGVFRCRPDGTQLHRIARGIWNPFALCVRDDGNIFAVDNDPGERPPCRLLHIVAGGDYGYQRLYGNEAHHPFVCWNGELRGTLPMVHPTGEGPSGVTPLGRGLLVTSWSDHRIDFLPLERKGASFTAERITLLQGGRFFRPVCIARDRSQQDEKRLTWYFTDWVSGAYQLHRLGRLWKLEIDPHAAPWLQSPPLEPPNDEAQLAKTLRSGTSKFSQAELLDWATHDDPFLAHAALQALARRAPGWQAEDIAKLSAPDRANALLALRIAIDPQCDGRQQPLDGQPWLARFLADADLQVRFEALRWVADARLDEFLPAVERMLGRADIDYRLFEAAVATVNTLSGKPESGIRNTELHLSRALNPSSPPRLRAFALRLLPTQPRAASPDTAALDYPQGLTVESLKDLISEGDLSLSLEAVRTLAGNPTAGRGVLVQLAADPAQPAALRAEAIAALASVAHQQLPLMIRLADDASGVVCDEALRALRGHTLDAEQTQRIHALIIERPDSADLARAVLDPTLLTQGRPAVTDTPAWLERLAAVAGPADPDAGRRIFHHDHRTRCAGCHRHGGHGHVVGPDLSAVDARPDRKWLVESLLQPSLEMAPQYRPSAIVLSDGRLFTGIRLRSSTSEVIRDTNGQNQTFKESEIETIRELDKSFMPDGLAHLLTDRELRDLIAFLEQPQPLK